MLNDYNRQLDIFNNEKFNEEVHVIGAGASGSWVVMCLAKLGVKNVHIWDFDKIEEHNIPNQCFPVSTIGNMKATEAGVFASYFGHMTYIIHTEAVTPATPLKGIVFMLTDTMKSRSEIFKGAIKFKPNVKLLIETRMGLDSYRIYCINPLDLDEVKRYEGTLYSDEEAEVSACGASKSVVTTGMEVASRAVRQMLNWNNGIELANEMLIDLQYNNSFCYNWRDK